MKPIVLLAALALLAPGLAQEVAPPTRQSTPVMFEDVNVFDGEALLGVTDVLIEAGRVAAVGDAVEVPEGAEVIDGTGMTLLPGLIDSHVHTFTPQMLVQGLVFGVTTVLDMFTDETFAAQMRQEQAAGGANYRADLFSSGWLATAPGGHGTQFGVDLETLTEPAQAEDWVEGRMAAGADYIKVVVEDFGGMGQPPLPTLDAETVQAVIDAAHAHDLLAITHVQELEPARLAVEAGSDGIAHMFSDAVPGQELVDLMVEQGTFVIPTLSVFQSIGPDDQVDQTLAADPAIAPFLTPADRQSLQSPYQTDGTLSFEKALRGVGMFHEAGVPVLAGSDAPNPGTAYGASLHRELELLTQAGLTPVEALAAATSLPASVFGLDDRGRIAPSMVADLVLVQGDPTQDILAVRDIVGIWKRGVRFDRDAYRESLAGAEQAAQEQAAALAESQTAPVSDFESGDLRVGFGQDWAPTTDVQAGGDSTAQIEVVEDGADGTARSLQVTGEIGTAFSLPWGGTMFMPGAQPFGPADLSTKPNLRFWAKGDGGKYRVQLFCANTGQTPPEAPFEAGGEWQEHVIDLGEVGGCDASGVLAVIFSASEPGEYSFQLDEVEFR